MYVCGVHECMCMVYVYEFGCMCIYAYVASVYMCGSRFVMYICSCAWVHMCVQVHVQTEVADGIFLDGFLTVY